MYACWSDIPFDVQIKMCENCIKELEKIHYKDGNFTGKKQCDGIYVPKGGNICHV